MSELFPMIPASAKSLWFLGAIALLLLALLCLFGYIAYSSRNVVFDVSREGLRVRGGPYQRMIPAGSLVSDEAKLVDLGRSTLYKPVIRTNGIGLPGYASGWFRLKNGERALLFVTDRSKVVYLPTQDGYSLLLSIQQPELFLRSLEALTAQ